MIHLGGHADHDADGQHHADACVALAVDEAPLRYPDGTPTGFALSPRLRFADGRCPDGTVRLDHHEVLDSRAGPLVFHRGGRGYADAANVKYGHLALADLADGPGPPVPAGQGRGGPAPNAPEAGPVVVRVRSIPVALRYKPLRGASWMHYGDPGADQGDRHDVHYTYLLWSFLDARGGGMVRALLRDGARLQPCDVPARRVPAYDPEGRVAGEVVGAYVRTQEGLYGWTVWEHRAGGAVVGHVAAA